MIIYNVTFFFPLQLAPDVRAWIASAWIPAATAAGCQPPLALTMEEVQDGVERLAVQSYFSSRSEADAFASREGSLLIDDMQARFGAQTVLAYPTLMTSIDL